MPQCLDRKQGRRTDSDNASIPSAPPLSTGQQGSLRGPNRKAKDVSLLVGSSMPGVGFELPPGR